MCLSYVLPLKMEKEIVEAKFGTNPAGEFKEEDLGSVNLQKCGWCEGSIQKMVGSNWYLSYGKNGLGENCKDLGDEVETWATAWDFTQTAFVADPSLPHNSAQFFGFLRNAIVHSPEICFKAIKIYCRKLNQGCHVAYFPGGFPDFLEVRVWWLPMATML